MDNCTIKLLSGEAAREGGFLLSETLNLAGVRLGSRLAVAGRSADTGLMRSGGGMRCFGG